MIRQACARVNRLMRLKIKGYFLLLSFVREDRPDEEDQAVGRHSAVEFKTLLRARDRSQHGEAINARLDIRCCAIFLS
jgi:hypothetical protein